MGEEFGPKLAPKNIPIFSALADSWIAGRIEQSRTPGAGYRPSSLAQWQTHIAHMKACYGEAKVNDIDAQAVERAIGNSGLRKSRAVAGYPSRQWAKS